MAVLHKEKNVLNTMMMSVAFMGLSSVLWVLCGYSLSFSGDLGGVIGNLKWFAFNGVGAEAGPYSDNIPNMVCVVSDDVCHYNTVAYYRCGCGKNEI